VSRFEVDKQADAEEVAKRLNEYIEGVPIGTVLYVARFQRRPYRLDFSLLVPGYPQKIGRVTFCTPEKRLERAERDGEFVMHLYGSPINAFLSEKDLEKMRKRPRPPGP